MTAVPESWPASHQSRGAVLVVGGDRIGGIVEGLTSLGYGPVRHHRGRAVRPVAIPADTTLVVVLIDYCSHSLMASVRQMAKARGIPVVYGRRSWAALAPAVARVALKG